ncbi:MAG: hypothetical protein HFI54_08170 [Lachnospiraceae bacterium]|nr:hypothetical protein [Lachnospiraceae bacterium]
MSRKSGKITSEFQTEPSPFLQHPFRRSRKAGGETVGSDGVPPLSGTV